jgi:AraC-like DNA-binding protein
MIMPIPAKEKTHFWTAPEYGDLELLNARYITHRFAPHFHEGYAIGIIESGVEQYEYRGTRHWAGSGSLVIINPAEIHTGSAADENGWKYRMTYPAITLMRQIAWEISGKVWDVPFFRESVIRDALIVRRFRALHLALEQGEARLLRDELLFATFGLLIQRYADNRPNPFRIGSEEDAITRAQDYIHNHYERDIALEEIATYAALSPFHLSRVFKAKTGLPPHKYLTQIRLNRARDLLAAGLAITDVAYTVGFADQSHLTKWFKRVFGVPPKQFMDGNRSD